MQLFKISVLILLLSLAIQPALLANPDEESFVELRIGYRATDFYNKIYVGSVVMTKKELVNYYCPISEKVNKIKGYIKYMYNDKPNKYPAICFIIMHKHNTKHMYSPWQDPLLICRWNPKADGGKGAYEKSYTFPYDEDIVIVHDPDRINIGGRRKDDDSGDTYYLRHNIMSLNLNNNIGENGTTQNNIKLIDDINPSLSTTFQYVKNETNPADPKQRTNIYFPVIRIPKIIKIIKKDDTRMNIPVTRAQIRVRATAGVNYNGVGFEVNDPEGERVFCIPMDGQSNEVCTKAPLYAPVTPLEGDPTIE